MIRSASLAQPAGGAPPAARHSRGDCPYTSRKTQLKGPRRRTPNDGRSPDNPLDQLGRSFAAVGVLIGNIRPEQWSARTPCTDWTVRQVVGHLIGMNRVFAAMLADAPPPRRVDEDPDGELEQAYRESAAALLAAFGQPGVLDRRYQGPLGPATGGDRLRIRLYDLLAHGWDLAQATGQPARLPDDIAEQALIFAREQLRDQARSGRSKPSRTMLRPSSGWPPS